MNLEKTDRRRWSWTQNQIKKKNLVVEIVEELEEYWPLTLRQIYYQMVANGLKFRS